MSSVKILKAYTKGDNAIFQVESDDDNPLVRARRCFVTMPASKFKTSNVESFVGKKFPGKIVYTDSVVAMPDSSFSLQKRIDGENVSLTAVSNHETGEVGYLDRRYDYTPAMDRVDRPLDRTTHTSEQVTKTYEQWEAILGIPFTRMEESFELPGIEDNKAFT